MMSGGWTSTFPGPPDAERQISMTPALIAGKGPPGQVVRLAGHQAALQVGHLGSLEGTASAAQLATGTLQGLVQDPTGLGLDPLGATDRLLV